jgi:hypothetical protein
MLAHGVLSQAAAPENTTGQLKGPSATPFAMSDRDPTGWDDPAYKRMCFIVAEATRIGYEENQPTVWIDDRGSPLTLSDCRASVVRATKQIRLQEKFDQTMEQLGAWAEIMTPDLEELEREVDDELRRRAGPFSSL